MHFCCSELILVTLIKQTNTTFVNLRGAFICFILCHTILSSKVFSRFKNIILVEKRWDCYQLTGLFSSFFKSLVKISRPLSHFGIFIANKEEGFSQLFLKILPKKKIWAIKRSDVLPQGTVMLCLYCYVFLMSSYFFISHVWEVNNCTAWVKPLFWNRSETIWNFIKTLRVKTAETQETHDVVLTL